MKTQYFTASSLDGFIATADHSLEWLFQLGDVNETSYPSFIQDVGALAMGSSTYEWMLRHVVKLGQESGAAWPYAQPTWVFSSRSLPPVAGADIRFADVDQDGSLVEQAARLGRTDCSQRHGFLRVQRDFFGPQ